MDIPTGQEELAEHVLVLIDIRDSTPNMKTKKLAGLLLASLEGEMLKVGLVLAENHEENPDKWNKKLLPTWNLRQDTTNHPPPNH